MSTRAIVDADERIRRNLAAAKEYLGSIIAHPEMMDTIPDGATIYVLPENDPDLAEINARAAERARRNGATVHVLRLPARCTPSDGEPDPETGPMLSPAGRDVLLRRESGRRLVASYQKVKAVRALRRTKRRRNVKAPWRDNVAAEATNV